MTSDTPPATTAPLTRAQQAEVERQHALIMRGTRFGDAETRATMERELRARLAVSLQDERPLRVYFGVDPTAPDLHLGHCVPLRKLRTFQQLGHHAILLIGDFTAQIGDASDKDALRPMHAAEVIAANARTYQEQAFKLLDREQTEVVHNADWLGALTFQDVVRLASHFTVAQFIERDNFRKRLDRARTGLRARVHVWPDAGLRRRGTAGGRAGGRYGTDVQHHGRAHPAARAGAGSAGGDHLPDPRGAGRQRPHVEERRQPYRHR